MTEQRGLFASCTVISITGADDPGADLEALTVARRFSQTCHAILVSTEDMVGSAHTAFGEELETHTGKWRKLSASRVGPRPGRRHAREIERLCGSLGLKAKVSIDQARQVQSHVAAGAAEVLIVLAQPRDPLMRQSHPFTELRHAAFRSRSAILLAPHDRAPGARGVVAIARDDSDPALAVARRIGEQAGEPVTRQAAARAALADMMEGITEGVPPTLIVKTRDPERDNPSLLTRLSILHRVPVLLLEADDTVC